MLIPKLFLGLIGSAGIGGVVSLSSIAGGDARDTWRISNNSTFPLFTCRASGSEISIYLKLKNPIGQLGDHVQQIEFWGDGKIGPINLSETSPSSQKTYKLTVFKSRGKSQLEVGGDGSSRLVETLWCDTNVFKVIEGRATTIHGSASQGILKELKDISLTLEEGCSKDNKKECSIKVGDQVGLEWADDFKPKVII